MRKHVFFNYPEGVRNAHLLWFFLFFLEKGGVNLITESDLFIFFSHSTMQLKQELQARGLLYQTTNDAFFELYEKGGEKFYCGYDPTADSLHLGHFLTFMAAVNFMKRGNTFVMLIGGAT